MGFFNFEGSLCHRYTTVARLREEGISTTKLSDADAPGVIEAASSLVMSVTDQWFLPVLDTLLLSGDDTPMIHHPKLIHIIDVLFLAMVDDENKFELLSNEFNLPPGRRYITRDEFISVSGRRRFEFFDFARSERFSRGLNNVELRGIFGWMDNFKNVKATALEEIVDGQATLFVDSVAGMKVNDAFIVFDPAEPNRFMHAIISAIDTGTKQLTFDAVNGLIESIPTGGTICVPGRVPRLVERATIILVNDLRQKIGSSGFLNTQFQKGIIQERTDNYMYKLVSAAGGDQTSSGVSTGSVQADNLLLNFVAPPFVGFA